VRLALERVPRDAPNATRGTKWQKMNVKVRQEQNFSC